ncbi:hypothetical protein IFM89_000784 [Coptis chinensis]|uniref:Uncharacterized protein n=1 Tax=Coptis chinensis TaxID=261450 RepID=A0A835ISY9_9MAGN|nr:hypothetical protein IFM89_000784 [Coptis chinensis]
MVLSGGCICGSKYWHRRHQLTITGGGCSIPKANRIGHVRLFDADRGMLNALANTSIEVMIGGSTAMQPLLDTPGESYDNSFAAGMHAWFAAFVDTWYAVVVPIIGVQGFRWAIDNNDDCGSFSIKEFDEQCLKLRVACGNQWHYSLSRRDLPDILLSLCFRSLLNKSYMLTQEIFWGRKDIDCMPLNPLDYMPGRLRRQSLASDKLHEHKLNGRSNNWKSGGHVKLPPSENQENADGTSHISPPAYPMNTLLKHAKSATAKMNLSDEVDFEDYVSRPIRDLLPRFIAHVVNSSPTYRSLCYMFGFTEV